MTEPKLTPCRSCGRMIEFIRTDDGKDVPVDLAPPIYRPTGRVENGRPIWVRYRDARVSHFVTCKNPEPFSGRNRSSLSQPQPDSKAKE